MSGSLTDETGEHSQFTLRSERVAWQRLLALDPVELATDPDETLLEDLYLHIVTAKVELDDPQATQENLVRLFELTQVCLESRNIFLDDAEKEIRVLEQTIDTQNQDIARLQQQQQLQQPQLQLSERSLDNGDHIHEMQQLKEELSDVTKRNAQLLKDLQVAEETIEAEKTNAAAVKEEMRKEKATRQEIEQTVEALTSDLQELTKAQSRLASRKTEEEFRQHIKEKNVEVARYLKEIEQLSNQNAMMANDLEALTTELETVVGEFEGAARENDSLKRVILQTDKQLQNVTSERNLLKQRVESLQSSLEKQAVDQRSKVLEKELHTVREALDTANENALKREAELTTATAEIKRLRAEISLIDLDSLRKSLQERDALIDELKRRLDESNRDFELLSLDWDEVAKLSASMQPPTKASAAKPIQRNVEIVKDLKKKMAGLQKQRTATEATVKQLTTTLVEKEQALAEANQRLEKFVKGVYGLPEALNEIEQLAVQKRIRDTDIAALTQQVNDLQNALDAMLDENDDLRKKCGMGERPSASSPTSPAASTRAASKRQAEIEKLRALNLTLSRELEQMEEERLQLKSKLRFHAMEKGGRAYQAGLNAEELAQVEDFVSRIRSGDVRTATEHHGSKHLQQLSAQLEKVTTELQQQRQAREGLDRQIGALLHENQTLQARITALGQASTQSDNATLQRILDAIQQKQSQPASAPVSEPRVIERVQILQAERPDAFDIATSTPQLAFPDDRDARLPAKPTSATSTTSTSQRAFHSQSLRQVHATATSTSQLDSRSSSLHQIHHDEVQRVETGTWAHTMTETRSTSTPELPIDPDAAKVAATSTSRLNSRASSLHQLHQELPKSTSTPELAAEPAAAKPMTTTFGTSTSQLASRTGSLQHVQAEPAEQVRQADVGWTKPLLLETRGTQVSATSLVALPEELEVNSETVYALYEQLLRALDEGGNRDAQLQTLATQVGCLQEELQQLSVTHAAVCQQLQRGQADNSSLLSSLQAVNEELRSTRQELADKTELCNRATQPLPLGDEKTLTARLSEANRQLVLSGLQHRTVERAHQLLQQSNAQLKADRDEAARKLALADDVARETILRLNSQARSLKKHLKILEARLEGFGSGDFPRIFRSVTRQAWNEAQHQLKKLALDKRNSVLDHAQLSTQQLIIHDYARQIRELTQERDQAQANVAGLEHAVREMQSSMKQTASLSTDEIARKWSDAQQTIVGLESQLKQCERRLELSESRIQALNDVQDKYDNTIAGLESSLQAMKQQERHYLDEISALQKVHDERQQHALLQQEQQNADAASKDDLVDQISKYKDLSESCSFKLDEMRFIKEKFEAENLELKSAVVHLQSQSDQAMVIGNNYEQYASLQQSVLKYKREVVALSARNLCLEAVVAEAERRLVNVEAEVLTMSRDYKQRLQTLMNTIDQFRVDRCETVPLRQYERLAALQAEVNERYLDSETARISLEKKLQGAKVEMEAAESRVIAMQDELKQVKVCQIKRSVSFAQLTLSMQQAGPTEPTQQAEALRRYKVDCLRLDRELKLSTEQAHHNEHQRKLLVKRLVELEKSIVDAELDFERHRAEWSKQERAYQQQVDYYQVESEKNLATHLASLKKVLDLLRPQAAEAVDRLNEHREDAQAKVVERQQAARIAELEKTVADLQDNKQTIEAQVAHQDNVASNLRVQLASKDNQDMSLSKAQAAYDAEKRKLVRAIEVAKTTISSLQNQLAKKSETIATLEKMLEQQRVDLVKVREGDLAEASQLRSQIMDLEQNLLHKAANVPSISKSAVITLEEYNAAMEAKETEVRLLRKRVESAEHELFRVVQENEQLQETCRQLQAASSQAAASHTAQLHEQHQMFELQVQRHVQEAERLARLLQDLPDRLVRFIIRRVRSKSPKSNTLPQQELKQDVQVLLHKLASGEDVVDEGTPVEELAEPELATTPPPPQPPTAVVEEPGTARPLPPMSSDAAATELWHVNKKWKRRVDELKAKLEAKTTQIRELEDESVQLRERVRRLESERKRSPVRQPQPPTVAAGEQKAKARADTPAADTASADAKEVARLRTLLFDKDTKIKSMEAAVLAARKALAKNADQAALATELKRLQQKYKKDTEDLKAQLAAASSAKAKARPASASNSSAAVAAMQEELQDLKLNFQDAVQLNVLYEDELRKAGVDVDKLRSIVV
ncbi:hypothetical protein RI367_005402 [Sorochytrium milnesiophthora]